MNYIKKIPPILMVFIFLFYLPVQAKHIALLIGVGEYPYLGPGQQLEGPVYDVKALKEMLISSLGFKTQNIIELINKDATSNNIRQTMNQLGQISKKNDFIFIYFSGHGTSSYDPDTQSLGLEPHTGALVPWDFKPDNDVKKMLASLIIGKRDIRPVLEKLEKSRRIFAVFDACYSGESVRSFGVIPQGKPKFLKLPFRSMMPVKHFSDDLFDDEEPAQWGVHTRKKPPYPYENTIYLSASSDLEKAMDIPSSHIPSFHKTIDGHPHGAMTNALLYGLQGNGDSNKDGQITYRELAQYVRSHVTEKFDQTPQMLSPENFEYIQDQALFQTNTKPFTSLLKTKTNLKVSLKGININLKNKIAGISGVDITDNNFDILVVPEKEDIVIYLANGTMLAKMPEHKVVERIKRQVNVKKLIDMAYPNQNFNVFVDLIGRQGVLVEGSSVGFNIKTESDAYILMINIEPSGFINVLYPYEPHQLNIVRANQDIHMPDIGEVAGESFGTEYIKVFAFKNQPQYFKTFMAKEFSPTKPIFDILLEMVTQANNSAQATIMVKTASKKDIQ